MSRPAPIEDAAQTAPEIAPQIAPSRPEPAAGVVGDSATAAASAELEAAVGALKTQAVRTLLEQAQAQIRADDWTAGEALALQALNLDERSGVAWWMLAICRERANDAKAAMACYRAALELLPDHAEIANDLGRLAQQMGEPAVAENLFRHFLARFPNHVEGVNNLACALREQERFSDAIDALRPALRADPSAALLWNCLGATLGEMGDVAESVTFYDEAVRLEPGFARARYNRGNARLAGGDPEGALCDIEAGLAGAAPADQAMMRLARAFALLACGRIGEGWDAYEARLDPELGKSTQFLVAGPRWAPDSELHGKSLLVLGEQGLGDEVLFANFLPDLVEAVGPQGRLALAVEPRQAALFQRSFPSIRVGAHATYHVEGRGLVRAAPFADALGPFDLWTPMASLLRRFRRSIEAYPARRRFLTADPARVAYWREILRTNLGETPKVGVVWKSLKLNAQRRRYFSPFDAWRGVLESPKARFVNLQYGDCEAELAQARSEGVEIWNPPGIDLKTDLDDVAALASALDLVLGPPNAATNLAAACGTETWMVSPPGAWTQLGTDRFPWYPAARVFTPPALNAWTPAMAQVAAAIDARF